MARIVDLTHPLRDGLEGFPGNAKVSVRDLHVIGEGGYHVSEVSFDTHLGTHIDVPSHVFKNGAGLDRLDLNRCCGPAIVVQPRQQGVGSVCEEEDLAAHAATIEHTPRLLIRQGWADRFGMPAFFEDFPGISPRAARWLADHQLVGLEAPSVHPQKHLEVHHTLLRAGIVIVEGLRGLDELPLGVPIELTVLPLRIEGADGCPVRAIARI